MEENVEDKPKTLINDTQPTDESARIVASRSIDVLDVPEEWIMVG
jgi:hypothetical protein